MQIALLLTLFCAFSSFAYGEVFLLNCVSQNDMAPVLAFEQSEILVEHNFAGPTKIKYAVDQIKTWGFPPWRYEITAHRTLDGKVIPARFEIDLEKHLVTLTHAAPDTRVISLLCDQLKFVAVDLP